VSAVIKPRSAALTRSEALTRTESFVPILRDRAATAERTATVPSESLDELHRVGLFRILQPTRVGGAELDVGMLVDACVILARGYPSTAWVWANYASHHWMLSLWPERAQDEIRGHDPDALIASSFVFPAERARRVAGDYVISGRWPFSSGVDPACWDMLAGVVAADVSTRDDEQRIFLLPRKDLQVIDNWRVMGLAGTNSKDVEARGRWRTMRRCM
jgi:3-hydroxy-9,10-secoandrosta-1,3,5(10)-triene-9,17-dione monooxygenase